MNNRLLQAGLVFALSLCAGAQKNADPPVPEKIKAPAGDRLILRAHAKGVQIYVCQLGTDGNMDWTLKAPEAELRDDHGKVIGHHSAGPAWKHDDGSEVTGKAAAGVASPRDDSIPWLLINAAGHSGTGVLSSVTTIQRINTRGGLPPPAGDCNPFKQNAEAKSRYTADYYFYDPEK